MEWYYILGMISYGIFLVQFILSMVGNGDLDVDFDGETDFSTSDLVSFKGLVHFLMGLSGWLVITGQPDIFNIIIACIVGVIFVVLLFYIYRLAMQLQSIPTKKYGKDLIGYEVVVYLELSTGKYICTVQNCGRSEELHCISITPTKVGARHVISDYKNGTYYIS